MTRDLNITSTLTSFKKNVEKLLVFFKKMVVFKNILACITRADVLAITNMLLGFGEEEQPKEKEELVQEWDSLWAREGILYERINETTCS